VTGRGVGRGDQVPDIVVHLAVRHHEERRAQGVGVVRKLVVVGVGVVQEAAMLDEELTGVDGREGPDHPAWRPLACGSLQGIDRLAYLVTLLVTGHADGVRAVPVVAVGEHVMVPGPEPLTQRRVAFHGQRAGGKRHRDLVTVDQAAQPPDSHPASVFHVCLGADIPDVGPVLEGVLTPGVVDAVLGERVLAAFLVVDHEVDRDPGAAGPVEVGWLRAVPDEVARRARVSRAGVSRAGRAGHGSVCHPPAVDHQGRAADVRGLVRAEEGDRRGHVFRFAEPGKRGP
jgi:hypothetical protein